MCCLAYHVVTADHFHILLMDTRQLYYEAAFTDTLDGCHSVLLVTTVILRVFVFFWGDRGSRGWYDNQQSALRPAAQGGPMCSPVCAKCLCVGGVLLLHSESACNVL